MPAPSAGTNPAFKAADREHTSVLAAAEKRTLIRIAAGIEKQALRYRYLAHLQSREMLSMTLEGHSGVAEAVLSGKIALARRRAERLMRRAHDVIARALSESAYALPGETGTPRIRKLRGRV